MVIEHLIRFAAVLCRENEGVPSPSCNHTVGYNSQHNPSTCTLKEAAKENMKQEKNLECRR